MPNANDNLEYKNEIAKILNNIKQIINNFKLLIKNIKDEKFHTDSIVKSHGLALNLLYKEVKKVNEIWFKFIWFPQMETYIDELENEQQLILKHNLLLKDINIKLPFKFQDLLQFINTLVIEIKQDYQIFKQELNTALKIDFGLKQFINDLPFFKEAFSFAKAVITGPLEYDVNEDIFELIKLMNTKTNWMIKKLSKYNSKINQITKQNELHFNWQVSESNRKELVQWKNQALVVIINQIETDFEQQLANLQLEFTTFKSKFQFILTKNFENNGNIDVYKKAELAIMTLILNLQQSKQNFYDIFNNWEYNVNQIDCNEAQKALIDNSGSAIKNKYEKVQLKLDLLIFQLQSAMIEKQWVITDFTSYNTKVNETVTWDAPIYELFFQNTINEIESLKTKFNWLDNSILTSIVQDHSFFGTLKNFTLEQKTQLKRFFPEQTNGSFDICDSPATLSTAIVQNEQSTETLFQFLIMEFGTNYQLKINQFLIDINRFCKNIMRIWKIKNKQDNFEMINDLLEQEIAKISTETETTINYLISEWKNYENKFFLTSNCRDHSAKIAQIKKFELKIYIDTFGPIVTLKQIKSKIEDFTTKWKTINNSYYYQYNLGEKLENAIEIGSNINSFVNDFCKKIDWLEPQKTSNQAIDANPNLASIEQWAKNEQVLLICNKVELDADKRQFLQSERTFLNQKNQQKFELWKTRLFPQFLKPISLEYNHQINQLSNLVADCQIAINQVLQQIAKNNEEISKSEIENKINAVNDKITELIDNSLENWTNWCQAINFINCHQKQKDFILDAGSSVYRYLVFYSNEFKILKTKLIELKNNFKLEEIRVELPGDKNNNSVLEEFLSILEIVNDKIAKLRINLIENQLFFNQDSAAKIEELNPKQLSQTEKTLETNALLSQICELPSDKALADNFDEQETTTFNPSSDFVTEHFNTNSSNSNQSTNQLVQKVLNFEEEEQEIKSLRSQIQQTKDLNEKLVTAQLLPNINQNYQSNLMIGNQTNHIPLYFVFIILTGGFFFLFLLLINWRKICQNQKKATNKSQTKKHRKLRSKSSESITNHQTKKDCDVLVNLINEQSLETEHHRVSINLNLLNENQEKQVNNFAQC